MILIPLERKTKHMRNLDCVVLDLPNAHSPLDTAYVHTYVYPLTHVCLCVCIKCPGEDTGQV